MTWLRAFLVGAVCLAAVAAACSGSEFSSAGPGGKGGAANRANVTMGAGGQGGAGRGGSGGQGTDGGTGCKTCADLRTECGTVPNGCGDTLDCGRCPTGQRCQLGTAPGRPIVATGSVI